LPAGAGETFALPAAFWSGFHRRVWERQGTVLRAPWPGPLASVEHVFERLVAASDRWRAGDHTFVPEFCVDHARVLADVGRYLPSSTDRSVADWTARVTGMLGGRTFGLVVDGYQVHDEPLWRRLCEFAAGLYARAGLPGEQAKAALFLGNYARTPFGLHRGRSTNFMFVLDGVKRIRAWPPAFFRGKEDLTNRLDYERYNAGSVVLEGKPGDVIYWPSPYWHIGEDAGGFSVAISLMLFMEPRPEADLAVAMEHALATGGGRRSGAGSVRATLRTLRALGQDPGLEQALIAARLNHVTGFGFTEVPPPAEPRRLRDDAVVRGRPAAPIRWRRVGERLVCSANGHAFVLPADPRVPALLRRLNSGRALRAGDVVAGWAGIVKRGRAAFSASPHEVRALLERLLALRGFAEGP
jgi:hypothetical protein